MKLFSTSALLCSFALGSLAQAAVPKDLPFPENYMYVDEVTDNKKLMIPIATYKNAAGQLVDVVGVIHVADMDYYEELDERFDHYDRVLFEMIDGQDLVRFKTLQKKVQSGDATAEEQKEYNNMLKRYLSKISGLSIVLEVITTLLTANTGLSLQQQGIDYAKPHFVFADMTQKELSAAMKKRGETVLGIALCDMLLGHSKKPKTNLSYAALMKRANAEGEERIRLMREFLIESLRYGVERGGGMMNTAIIISRNEKAMAVLDDVMKDDKIKRIALFYGCAHMPDFHDRLLARGYKLQSLEWLESFSTNLPWEDEEDYQDDGDSQEETAGDSSTGLLAVIDKDAAEKHELRSSGISPVIRGTRQKYYWDFEFKTPKNMKVIKVHGGAKKSINDSWDFELERMAINAEENSVTVSYIQDNDQARQHSLDTSVHVFLSDQEPVTHRMVISDKKGTLTLGGKSLTYELKKKKGDKDDEYQLHLGSDDQVVVYQVRLYAPMKSWGSSWSDRKKGIDSSRTYRFPKELKGALLEFTYYPGEYTELEVPIKATLKPAAEAAEAK